MWLYGSTLQTTSHLRYATLQSSSFGVSSMSDLNPYNNNYGSAIANDIVCSFLAAISVGVRLHVRRNIVGKTKIDDWLLLTSAVSSVSECHSAKLIEVQVLFIVSNALDITSWVLVADEGVNVVGLASEVGFGTASRNSHQFLTSSQRSQL